MSPTPSPAVVQSLYRCLLRSARQLEHDLCAGRTLYAAVRSGAVKPSEISRSDWQGERKYENRMMDISIISKKRAFVHLVRPAFQFPLSDDEQENSARLDAGFAEMRALDDHNAIIRRMLQRGCFEPKERMPGMKYHIGDVVETSELGRGVVCGWAVDQSCTEDGSRVTYDILLDATQYIRERVHFFKEQELQRDTKSGKPIVHPSLLLFFDGFEENHHIPSEAMAKRYPMDKTVKDRSERLRSSVFHRNPSIIELQQAEETQLIEFLKSNDTTIMQLTLSSLEGRWISEHGECAAQQMHRALQLVQEGAIDEARQVFMLLVQDHPPFAYAWNKYGMLELRNGNFAIAREYFERAVALKPHMIDALAGLATSLGRLGEWSSAHEVAQRILRLQPSNATARHIHLSAISHVVTNAAASDEKI